jgi:uncharacterized protein with HEPN domain
MAVGRGCPQHCKGSRQASTDIFDLFPMTPDEYLADQKTRYAVMRGYEILGEAVRHLSEPLKMANADIPWTKLAAVRIRIVHGYFGIDDSILFTTIDEDLKPILPRPEALARAQGVFV